MPWNKIKRLSAECPECDSAIAFVTMPKIGQTVFCALCGSKLEVAFLYPIMLDYADDDLPLDGDDLEYEGYEFDDEF